MTDLLARHWATGQSTLEDQHLGALLAWIDPPDGLSPAPRPRCGPSWSGTPTGQLLCPPAGPATDPAFDNKLLAPAIERYDRARRRSPPPRTAEATTGSANSPPPSGRSAPSSSRTRPTWDAVWRGLDLLRTLPEGARVGRPLDARPLVVHRPPRPGTRRRAPAAPPRRRGDRREQARRTRERAQARLEAQEALDDPLVMAGRRLAGEAFAGEVTDVVMAYCEGKRPSPRPLVTRPHGRPAAPGRGRRRCTASLDEGSPQSAEFVADEADPAAG